jgi:hypothetical protein
MWVSLDWVPKSKVASRKTLDEAEQTGLHGRWKTVLSPLSRSHRLPFPLGGHPGFDVGGAVHVRRGPFHTRRQRMNSAAQFFSAIAAPGPIHASGRLPCEVQKEQLLSVFVVFKSKFPS